jgi:hypothetical protein
VMKQTPFDGFRPLSHGITGDYECFPESPLVRPKILRPLLHGPYFDAQASHLDTNPLNSNTQLQDELARHRTEA